MKRIEFILFIIPIILLLSNCSKKTSTPEELIAPTNLQITQIDSSLIQLTWQDNSNCEEKFLINRKKGEFGWQVNYGEVGSNIIDFVDNISIDSDTIYTYKVRASSDQNYSEYTNSEAWFSDNSSPTELILVQSSADSLRLEWQDNCFGEEGFRIDKEIHNREWIEDYQILPANSTSFIDYFPTSGNSSSYRVFAFSGSSYSSFVENRINGIDSLSLQINLHEIVVDEVIQVRALAISFSENVTDGSIITFTTDLGFFQTPDGINLGNTTQTPTENEMATVYFNASSEVGIATITAYFYTVSVSDEIIIHPGTPRYMELRSLNEDGEEQYTIPVNSSEELTIEALVMDQYYNPVSSENVVFFETTLGTIQPMISPTNNEGIAVTTFSPGISAGIAEISAVSDSAQSLTVITVTSDDVNSIQFVDSDNVYLDVQGVGGIESYELAVNLFDMTGNLIDDDRTVFFELLDAPQGTNINGFGNSDSTLSVNGQAAVTLYSGTASGIVEIKAYTYNNQGIEISAIKSNIVVNPGPPSSFELISPEHSEGENMGGGVWRIEIGALLSDVYENPVIDGIAVWYSLPENPGFASINAGASTGNENGDGESIQGIAFTDLSYEGAHSNEEILIRIETAFEFIDEIYLTLPIQYPWIDASFDQHDAITWYDENTPDSLSTEIIVMVKDGQNNSIYNQSVLFSSTLGTFIDSGTDDDENVFTESTGESGSIYKSIYFFKNECPPPQSPEDPGMIACTITIEILGTDASTQIHIILVRYV